MGFKTRFIKLKENLIFALIKGKTDKGIEYLYSDKEKTELDEVYLSRKGKVAKDWSLELDLLLFFFLNKLNHY